MKTKIPHNKLKCDQLTSDEQIATDNVKISTLETSISGESASVAQLTADISQRFPSFPDVTAICEKQLAEY